MILSIHQPAYLPWLGYFDRITRSDLFIFLDTVQFERNSFTNRNRIKTANGPIWLTVPVRLDDHFSQSVAEVEIDERRDWRRKHLRSIEQSYSRAPGFEDGFPRLAETYSAPQHRLAELCFSQLKFWVDQLGIGTAIMRASELAVTGRKSDLILSLCRHVSATTYLSGPQGREYLKEDLFAANGIEVRYHDYVHPEYPQFYGEFIPAMGVVDYWMNCREARFFGRPQ